MFRKKKLTNNRLNIAATGGGSSTSLSLTSIEQAVADLLNLKKSINPPGRVFGESAKKTTEQDVNNNISQLLDSTAEFSLETVTLATPTPTDCDIEETETPQEEVEVQRPKRRRTTSGSQSLENERLKLLTEQTEVQEQLLRAQNKIAENTTEIAECLKKLLDLKKIDTLQKQRKEEQNVIMFEINLKIKQKKLELLEKQLEQ